MMRPATFALVIVTLFASSSAFAEYWSCRAQAAEDPHAAQPVFVVYVSAVFGPMSMVSTLSPYIEMSSAFSEYLSQKYGKMIRGDCAGAKDEAASQTAQKQYVQMMRERQKRKVIETGWKYEPAAAPAP
jgi:hypothetical protein